MLERVTARRVSVPDSPPNGYPVVSGSGLRHARRPRKLTSAEESAIRALSSTHSLRALAVEFGVSYETVRTLIRDSS